MQLSEGLQTQLKSLQGEASSLRLELSTAVAKLNAALSSLETLQVQEVCLLPSTLTMALGCHRACSLIVQRRKSSITLPITQPNTQPNSQANTQVNTQATQAASINAERSVSVQATEQASKRAVQQKRATAKLVSEPKSQSEEKRDRTTERIKIACATPPVRHGAMRFSPSPPRLRQTDQGDSESAGGGGARGQTESRVDIFELQTS